MQFYLIYWLWLYTVQKMKKPFMENFIFCAVSPAYFHLLMLSNALLENY